jgi:predicted ATPase
VTFLFTDVEGSTVLWEEHPDVMAVALAQHDEILRLSVEAHGGYVFSTAGDSFGVAFDRAGDGITCAGEIQAALAAAVWPDRAAIRVRVGVHTGEAEERDGNYFGSTLNRAARIMSAGHGGQVLVSAATAELLGDVELLDLGEHRLKDVPEPVRILQLGPGEFRPLRTSSSAKSNLPALASRLVGRDEDVRTVRMLLAEHRLVTLMAAGGTGKTRLAVEVADQELPHWHDGVWFVDLTKAANDEDVATEVARSIGLEIEGGDVAARVAGFVRSQSMLIVLDNCEHVIDACAELVETILTERGSSKILATSREWLDIAFERVYQVPSLDTDDDGAAVQLFIERARASNPAFAADDRSLIAQVCVGLDGMPLAIELAAARVSVLPLDQLLAGLSDRFRLLSGGRRRQRGRTLEATIDWSYDLLEPDEQRFFRRLGVFLGSFDIAAAASVTDTSLAEATDLIEALLARSLVASSSEWSGRFQLLETLKAYAEDRLIDAGEAESSRERHVQHFTELVRVENPFELNDRRRAINFIADLSNLVAAADWLEAEQRWDDLAPLLAPLSLIDYTTASTSVRRLQRCIEQIRDPDLIDHLRHAEAHAAAHAGSWSTFLAAARAMSASDNARTAAFGHLLRSIPLVYVDAPRAMQAVDRFIDGYGPDPTGAARAEALALRCSLAASAYDLTAAWSFAQQANAAAASLETVPSQWPNTRFITAVLAWIDGDMTTVMAALADVEETFAPAGSLLSAADGRLWRDTGTRLVAGFVHCLASLGPLHPGTPPGPVPQDVRDHVIECASGRVAQMESDGLIVLTLIALREQDVDRAAELLEAATLPRSQGSHMLAMYLADVLGMRERYQGLIAGRPRPDSDWYIERPKGALHAEIKRRSWL